MKWEIFISPISLASVPIISSGTIQVHLPNTIRAGMGYKVRLILRNAEVCNIAESQPLIIKDAYHCSKITLYPNPTHSGYFIVQAGGLNLKEIWLYNTQRQLVQKVEWENPNKGEMAISLKGEPYGIYFLLFIVGEENPYPASFPNAPKLDNRNLQFARFKKVVYLPD